MGEPVNFTDSENKAIMKVEGGADILDLFKHTGNFMDDDTYDQVVDKIKLSLQQLGDRTAPVYNLLSQKPQGDQSFDVRYRRTRNLNP